MGGCTGEVRDRGQKGLSGQGTLDDGEKVSKRPFM